jgi:hypothetical protein
MVKIEGIKGILQRCGIKKTDEEINSSLGAINQKEINRAIKETINYYVWDGFTPINEAPVKAFQDKLLPGWKAYVITINGKVVYFQPHKPDVEGYEIMTEHEIHGIAGTHIDSIAGAMADNEVIRQLAE